MKITPVFSGNPLILAEFPQGPYVSSRYGGDSTNTPEGVMRVHRTSSPKAEDSDS